MAPRNRYPGSGRVKYVCCCAAVTGAAVVAADQFPALWNQELREGKGEPSMRWPVGADPEPTDGPGPGFDLSDPGHDGPTLGGPSSRLMLRAAGRWISRSVWEETKSDADALRQPARQRQSPGADRGLRAVTDALKPSCGYCAAANPKPAPERWFRARLARLKTVDRFR